MAIHANMWNLFNRLRCEDHVIDHGEAGTLISEAVDENAASGGCCGPGRVGTKSLRELYDIQGDKFTEGAKHKVENWLGIRRRPPSSLPSKPGYDQLSNPPNRVAPGAPGTNCGVEEGGREERGGARSGRVSQPSFCCCLLWFLLFRHSNILVLGC